MDSQQSVDDLDEFSQIGSANDWVRILMVLIDVAKPGSIPCVVSCKAFACSLLQSRAVERILQTSLVCLIQGDLERLADIVS